MAQHDEDFQAHYDEVRTAEIAEEREKLAALRRVQAEIRGLLRARRFPTHWQMTEWADVLEDVEDYYGGT